MDKRKGYICIFVATILFSSMEIVLKMSAGEFHPIQITMGRFLVGGIVLLPFAISGLRKRNQRITGTDIKWFVVLGLIGVLISMTFYQLSILHIEASKVAVLFSSNPLFVTIFAVIILKEALLKHKLAAVIGDLLGVICIVQPWHPGLNVAGVVFVMISAMTFALYGVLGKKESQKLGGIALTCGSFLFGSIEMMVFAALSHVGSIGAFLESHGLGTFVNIPFLEGYNAGNLPYFLYVALFVTGMGYASYFMAMEYVSAQEASMVFFFKPVLAAAAAAIVLREEIPAAMIAGIGLILASSMVSMYGDHKMQQKQESKELEDSGHGAIS